MTEPKTRRLVGICGLVAFVLSVVIGLVPPPPALGSAGTVIVPYYAAHGYPVMVWNYLGLVGLMPHLVVMAYTTGLVKGREGPEGWLWLLLLLSGGMLNAAAYVVLADLQGLAYVAPSAAPDLAQALSNAGAMRFGMLFVSQGTYAFAFAWACAVTRIWPGWVAALAGGAGVAAAIASVGCVFPVGVLAPGGLITLGAFGLFFVWVLAYSVLILLRPPTPLLGGSR